MVPYFKAFHIIFIVTWFAALFYIVRLFIYQTEAQENKPETRDILTSQFQLMSKRLWLGIGWPSSILTLIFGIGLLILMPGLLKMPWMHIKLTLIVLLFIYHHIIHFRYKELQRGIYKYSSIKLRVLNEVATLFLVSIVFVVMLKNLFNPLWGTIGIAIFALLLYLAIHSYKKKRLKND